MKNAIFKLFLFTTILGIIAFSLNVLFDYPVITYINKTYINGIAIYKFDVFSYLRNLQDGITNTPFIELSLPPNTPIREFFEYNANPLNNIEIVGKNIVVAIENTINVLITVANILILVVNAILYPLRIAAYVIQVILTLIGLPFNPETANPLKWLVDFAKTLTTLEIPFINFIQFNYD